MPDLVICVATDLERCALPESSDISGLSVEVLRTGIGPVNAAMSLTRYLARESVETVISLGIGGAYPGSGLEVGEVVCASSENHGDLGAESIDGFLDMRALGFEVVAGFYNELPLDRFPASRRLSFVTRSTCTGQLDEARAIVERTGGAVESMEGSAIVHVAIAHGLPVGEVRGISNRVADRDRSTWRVHEAAQAAGEVLLQWIEEGAC
jgi:futalosine hydrolase